MYRIGSAKALLDMLRAEKGYAYQTHPRTKGRLAFPTRFARPSISATLPDFDHYGELTEAVARGDFFVSTGEVLLPETSIAASGADQIRARFTAEYTLPLRLAEVVWGDGGETHRKIYPLDKTREFGRQSFDFTVDAKDWKWARIAVWDVAGDGAFINPVWK